MFLWWSSTKIVQAIWIRQKTWLLGGGAYFPYIIYIENFKNLLVRNHWTDFNIILQKCSFGDPLLRLFKPFGFVKKHSRQGVGLIFPMYLQYSLRESSTVLASRMNFFNFPRFYYVVFAWILRELRVDFAWILREVFSCMRKIFLA